MAAKGKFPGEHPWAPPGFSAGGGKHRGAAGAERGGVWGGADVFFAYFRVRNRL